MSLYCDTRDPGVYIVCSVFHLVTSVCASSLVRCFAFHISRPLSSSLEKKYLNCGPPVVLQQVVVVAALITCSSGSWSVLFFSSWMM